MCRATHTHTHTIYYFIYNASMYNVYTHTIYIYIMYSRTYILTDVLIYIYIHTGTPAAAAASRGTRGGGVAGYSLLCCALSGYHLIHGSYGYTHNNIIMYNIRARPTRLIIIVWCLRCGFRSVCRMAVILLLLLFFFTQYII